MALLDRNKRQRLGMEAADASSGLTVIGEQRKNRLSSGEMRSKEARLAICDPHERGRSGVIADLRFSRTIGAGPVLKRLLRLLRKDNPMPTAAGLELNVGCAPRTNSAANERCAERTLLCGRIDCRGKRKWRMTTTGNRCSACPCSLICCPDCRTLRRPVQGENGTAPIERCARMWWLRQ